MSSLSVIQTHKNVLQQSLANNNNQQKEFHSSFPSKTFSKDDILLTNPARKKSVKTATKDMKTNPQILAVARRNARERNRVKQVNNGFANLRERIPNFIAASYESGRGNNKKLSKVETLRMAVEYIRSLEDLLALDDQEVEALSRASYPSPTASGSPNLSIQKGSYQFSDMSASADEDMSTTSSPPPQYVRINTLTNTYEIIPAQIYEDSENFEPLTGPGHILTDSSLIHPSNLDFKVEDMNLLNGTDSRDSLSPEIYSDQSFSPENIERFPQSKCFVPIFNQFVDNKFIMGNIKQENFDETVLTSASESFSDVQKGINNAMQWWENQTSISGS